MNTLREAAQQAEDVLRGCLEHPDAADAIAALQAALAEPDHFRDAKKMVAEPVAWMSPGKERLEFARKDTVYGSHTIPLYTEPQPKAEQEPVAHSVVSGALFDFMGWLTSRKERLILSSVDDAAPAAEAITAFAKMRGLSLDDAKVQDWNTAPQPKAEPCQWHQEDDDTGAWASGCGELWSFIDGGPNENRVRFCHGCGKPVEVQP
jgi:hypothetical protein